MEISLKVIADASGFSRTTVSLALRGHPRISEETRRIICTKAAELGYQPHADVSRVMGKIREKRENFDRPVMALITDYPTPAREWAPLSPTWKGFSARCRELGYLPEEFRVGTCGLPPKRLTQVLKARGIRGVVFIGLKSPSLAAEMDLSTFSCAAIGNSIQTPLLHRATSDKYFNTQLCCEELWAQGARRIGLAVPSYQEHRVEHTFLSGYLVFHHLHRHKGWRTPLVKEEAWEPDAIIAWLQRHKMDGCVVAYQGVSNHLPDVKVAEINVIGPGRTGVNQCHDRIAAGAVDLVDAQLRRNLFGLPDEQKSMLVKGHWVSGR